MQSITIMSWNMRTFGIPAYGPDQLRIIKDTIVNCEVDLLCIQEVSIGRQQGEDKRRIGSPINIDIYAQLIVLVNTLIRDSGNPHWNFIVSGRNKGRNQNGQRMADAYAFLYKGDKLSPTISPPKIIVNKTVTNVNTQIAGGKNISIRKPGYTRFEIINATPSTYLNVVSWHSRYPSNNKEINGLKGDIAKLAKLTQVDVTESQEAVGVSSLDGNEAESYQPPTKKQVISTEIPKENTIVLGDFNLKLTPENYSGLIGQESNYVICIGSFDEPIGTTYTRKPEDFPPPAKAKVTDSSYDNIFLLVKGQRDVQLVNDPGHSGAYDFIQYAISREPATSSDIYYKYYKGSNYAGDGISDHLPVYQRFEIQGT